MQIRLKRVYDSPRPGDGQRVLVDRVWPRGLKRSTARIDLWLREIAPSPELRRWFGHDPGRWSEFREKYFCELNRNGEKVRELTELVSGGRVTLLFGSREKHRNNAAALKEYLELRARAAAATEAHEPASLAAG